MICNSCIPASYPWSVVIHGVQEWVDHIRYRGKVPEQLLESVVQHFKQGPVEVVPRKGVFRLFTLSLLRMGVGGGDFNPLEKKNLGSVHILHNQRLTDSGHSHPAYDQHHIATLGSILDSQPS